MSLQKVGEKEDQNLTQQARDANMGSKGMKEFRHRHKEELNKGEDVRSNKHLVDAKKKKFISKMRESGMKKGSREGISDKFTGGKKVTEKSSHKIMARTAPTRSKAIVKGGKGGIGSRDVTRGGGRGGRGGSVPGRRQQDARKARR